jgi:hypothetical protein
MPNGSRAGKAAGQRLGVMRSPCQLPWPIRYPVLGAVPRYAAIVAARVRVSIGLGR